MSRGGRSPCGAQHLFTCSRREGRVGMATVQSRERLALVFPHFQASPPWAKAGRGMILFF